MHAIRSHNIARRYRYALSPWAKFPRLAPKQSQIFKPRRVWCSDQFHELAKAEALQLQARSTINLHRSSSCTSGTDILGCHQEYKDAVAEERKATILAWRPPKFMSVCRGANPRASGKHDLSAMSSMGGVGHCRKMMVHSLSWSYPRRPAGAETCVR